MNIEGYANIVGTSGYSRELDLGAKGIDSLRMKVLDDDAKRTPHYIIIAPVSMLSSKTDKNNGMAYTKIHRSYDKDGNLVIDPPNTMEQTTNPAGQLPDLQNMSARITFIPISSETTAETALDALATEACQAYIEVEVWSDANDINKAVRLAKESFCNSFGMMMQAKQAGLTYTEYTDYVSVTKLFDGKEYFKAISFSENIYKEIPVEANMPITILK